MFCEILKKLSSLEALNWFEGVKKPRKWVAGFAIMQEVVLVEGLDFGWVQRISRKSVKSSFNGSSSSRRSQAKDG